MRHNTAFILAILPAVLLAAPDSSPAGWSALPNEVPGSTLPVVDEHTYKMSGRVRALVLWIVRDDVGSGVIRWRGAGDDHAYELLIGSDPLRAPGHLNKWGFLAEESLNGECSVVGVMSKSTEERLGDVKANLASNVPARPFDTIRGRVTPDRAFAQVTTVQASSAFTYREADSVLALALGAESSPAKQIERPTGSRPGFLTAVAELIRTTAESSAKGERLSPATVTYVYGDRLFDLKLLEATPIARFEKDGRSYDHVVQGKFETLRAGAWSGSRFELVYGTSGSLAQIPIVISYQPTWWLQVELNIQQ